MIQPNIWRSPQDIARSLLGIAGFTTLAGNKVIAQTTTQLIKEAKNMTTNPVNTNRAIDEVMVPPLLVKY